MRLTLIHCLLCSLALGQEPVPLQASPAKPEEKGAIEGQVLDSQTGAPLAKAQVVLGGEEGPRPQATRTDTAGRFLFSELQPGKYLLFLERRGYVRQAYGARSMRQPGTVLTLAPGQRLRITARMTPQAVLAGKIGDEDGEPLSNVHVRAVRAGYAGSARGFPGEQGVMTNDLGEFRIHSLPPGRYYIQATYNPMETMMGAVKAPGDQSEPALGYVPTFYPGTKDPSSAAVVEVAPGAEIRGIQFTLARARTWRVRGRVLNAVTGRTERNMMVSLMPRQRGLAMFTTNRAGASVDRSGKFELRGVLPGSYYAFARWFSESGRYFARQPVDVTDSDVEGVELVIGKGMDLPGVLRTEDAANADLGKMWVYLRPSEFLPMPMPARSGVKDDGTFLLEKVPPGDYQVLLASMPKGFYLKSVRLGDREALEAGLSLESGAAPATLEIVLGAGAGEIGGVVLDDDQQAQPGATVVLMPEPERRKQQHLIKVATTDQNGRFTIDGVAPGDYRLFAWKEIEGGAWLDPDFMKPVEKLGTEVTVREGSRESAQLKIIPVAE